ncbi:hypothetical protein EU245_14390 [Lentibacillus lipolyticus]|nr:hypothetical protein EU245_14390 [Lentibacillus lipolyticus]
MALVTLLEYLKNNELKHNILINHVILKNITLNYFEISNDHCWVLTNQRHEVTLDITRFKKITFDAAVWEASNTIDMINCLNDLEEDIQYNAYLENEKGEVIAGFYRIGKN